MAAGMRRWSKFGVLLAAAIVVLSAEGVAANAAPTPTGPASPTLQNYRQNFTVSWDFQANETRASDYSVTVVPLSRQCASNVYPGDGDQRPRLEFQQTVPRGKQDTGRDDLFGFDTSSNNSNFNNIYDLDPTGFIRALHFLGDKTAEGLIILPAEFLGALGVDLRSALDDLKWYRGAICELKSSRVAWEIITTTPGGVDATYVELSVLNHNPELEWRQVSSTGKELVFIDRTNTGLVLHPHAAPAKDPCPEPGSDKLRPSPPVPSPIDPCKPGT